MLAISQWFSSERVCLCGAYVCVLCAVCCVCVMYICVGGGGCGVYACDAYVYVCSSRQSLKWKLQKGCHALLVIQAVDKHPHYWSLQQPKRMPGVVYQACLQLPCCHATGLTGARVLSDQL